MLCFLQIKDKTLYHQKDYNLLYGNFGFTAVFWNRTHNLSDICLHNTCVNFDQVY